MYYYGSISMIACWVKKNTKWCNLKNDPVFVLKKKEISIDIKFGRLQTPYYHGAFAVLVVIGKTDLVIFEVLVSNFCALLSKNIHYTLMLIIWNLLGHTSWIIYGQLLTHLWMLERNVCSLIGGFRVQNMYTVSSLLLYYLSHL